MVWQTFRSISAAVMETVWADFIELVSPWLSNSAFWNPPRDGLRTLDWIGGFPDQWAGRRH